MTDDTRPFPIQSGYDIQNKPGRDVKGSTIPWLLARNELLEAVLEAAQVPRHDYCGTDDWFIALDKAVYEATTDFGEQYRDKYADSGKQESPEIFEGTREMLDRITKGGGG